MNDADCILTERLVLRPPSIHDARSIGALMSPEVSRWLASWPPAVDLELAGRRIAEAQAEADSGRAVHWLIERRDVGDVIGWIRISRSEVQANTGELGFWLGTASHGRGFATEAVGAAVRAGFDRLRLTRLEAGAQVSNEASLRVMRRIGMCEADRREVWSPTRGRYEACIYYVLERIDRA